MNTPSLVEVLIVALGFSIVGTYVLCCRHFLNASPAEESVKPAKSSEYRRLPNARAALA